MRCYSLQHIGLMTTMQILLLVNHLYHILIKTLLIWWVWIIDCGDDINSIVQKLASSSDEGIEMVRDGKAWAYFSIPADYSKSYIERCGNVTVSDMIVSWMLPQATWCVWKYRTWYTTWWSCIWWCHDRIIYGLDK